MLVWKCVLRVRKRPIADDFPTTVVRLRTANDLKVRSYLVLVDKWVRRRRALLSRLRYVGRCRVAKSPGIDLVPAERVRCIFSVNSVKSATRTASKGERSARMAPHPKPRPPCRASRRSAQIHRRILARRKSPAPHKDNVQCGAVSGDPVNPPNVGNSTYVSALARKCVVFASGGFFRPSNRVGVDDGTRTHDNRDHNPGSTTN